MQGNHRMFGVGRALCGSPSPTPRPSRVTQSRLHSTAARRGWNISREGDSTASLGSLGQGSVTQHPAVQQLPEPKTQQSPRLAPHGAIFSPARSFAAEGPSAMICWLWPPPSINFWAGETLVGSGQREVAPELQGEPRVGAEGEAPGR